MRLDRRATGALLALPLLLAACSGGGGTSASGTSSAASSSASSAAASSSGGSVSAAAASASSTPGSLAGCHGGGGGMPSGVSSATTIDVDGDSRPDTAWITRTPDSDGGVPFGVTTAAGGTFSATVHSASPIARSLLVADVNGHGEIIALVSDGRQVLLYAVSACSFIPMNNAQGHQYAFDLGFTGYGTGVGCVDANGDGTRDLVGLKVVDGGQGSVATIQRTIVDLHGPNARNGTTDSVVATRASMADEARTVSCGDLTLAHDGVTSGP